MRVLHTIGRSVVLSALVGTILVTFSGCMTVGRKLDVDAVDSIKKNRTTRQEVVQAIGSPDQVTRDGDGNVTYMYMYARTQVKPETYIPYIGPMIGGTRSQNQTVIISFGPDDIVNQITSTMGGMETSQGLSSGKKARMPEVEDNKRPK